MPARPDSQTEFVRPRWSAYVRNLVDSDAITRTRLAALTDVPTSRVKDWIEAERGVEPHTAFQIGENLRSVNLPTDGFCALYACGYLADLFVHLRALTAGSRASRTSRAFALATYCALPGRMLGHEIRILELGYGREPRTASWESSDAYEFARLKFAAASEKRRQTLTAHLSAEINAQPGLESSEIQKILNSSEPSTNVDLNIDAIPALMLPAGAVAGLAAKATRLPTWLDFLTPALDRNASTSIMRDGSGVILSIVIAVSRAARGYDPATMTPRLWRMLGEWAYGVDPDLFTRWRPLLPAPYRSYRDEEEQP